LSVLLWFSLPTRITAQTCPNPIVCENLLPGDKGWDISGSGDPGLQGFATSISVNAGETVFFKITTDAPSYRLHIYRIGYYGGTGARKITTINPSVPLPQIQPPCLVDSHTKLVDCGTWSISASWDVPPTAVSGIYIALLVRPDTEGASKIVYVDRNDASKSDILFKTSDETWQAYNHYGGSSLQGGDGTWDLSERAVQVSYNRPIYTRAFEKSTWFFDSEYALVRWLEANGYDVSYFTGSDAAKNGHLILSHKVLLSAGRDEYVSGPQRASLEAARDAGVNLAFFTGGEAFWKTKWDRSIDGTNTSFRTLVCYKETLNDGVPRSTDPLTWTGTWRDPRFSPPSDGARPENSLTGSLFMVNNADPDLSIEVSAADGRMRFWRNTSIAALSEEQTIRLSAGSLGSNWDADVDNGFRPVGLVPLSNSTYALDNGLLLDHGTSYGAGTATHRMTLYRAASGALVFSAGTARWPWGLDGQHDGQGFAPDVRMQQATVNLLADMGVQPVTLQTPIQTATKSADITPPISTILSPTTVHYGIKTKIMGTATDVGGGVVGAVEVSTDHGQTWHPAVGRENWTYDWTPLSVTGSATVMVRASDDSANVQATPGSIGFNVAGGPTLWTDLTVPVPTTHNDTAPVEVGMKFQADVAGYITGVRFYKGLNNTGTHTGSLWSRDGKQLASVTFTNETPSGWQQARFSSPVRILANTTYVVSYYAPNGAYTATANFFKTGTNRGGPLRALADGIDGPNGLFIYAAAGGGFPTETFNAANYWVDVVFSVLNGTPHSVELSWTASTSAGVIGYNLYRAAIPGGPYVMLNTSPIVATTYIDSGVISGQTYFYTVAAINSTNNESTYSDEVAALIPTP
jgi:hypothetical protein